MLISRGSSQHTHPKRSCLAPRRSQDKTKNGKETGMPAAGKSGLERCRARSNCISEEGIRDPAKQTETLVAEPSKLSSRADGSSATLRKGLLGTEV